MSLDELRQRLQVAERRRPHAEAVRIGRLAVAHNEVAELSLGRFDGMIGLTCGRLDQAGYLADNRSFGQPLDRLPDDPDRLPELLEAYEIPVVGVACGADGHIELHLVVRRVRLVFAHVLRYTRPAKRGTAEPDSNCLAACDDADPLGALEPDAVVGEQF